MHKRLYNTNSVKGVSKTSTSLGRNIHVRQVDSDRHPETVSNKFTQRIGSWNVRTLYQPGKLHNIKQEMHRLNINMLGLCETRWQALVVSP